MALTCTPQALAANAAPFNSFSQHEKLAILAMYLYRQQNIASQGVVDPKALVANAVCFAQGCSKSRLMSYLLLIQRQKAIDAGWVANPVPISAAAVKSASKELCVLSDQMLLSIIVDLLCQLS